MTSYTPAHEQLEHERRFLVAEPQVLDGHQAKDIKQAYLWAASGAALRVRWTRSPLTGSDDDEFWMTFKGPKSETGSRIEIESEYSPLAVRFMIQNSQHVIIKQRFSIISEGGTFDVDVFAGKNKGLIIAEFEATEGAVACLRRPWWCGAEITADQRYNNENLAQRPWLDWPENQ